ncbi:MAG TPA: hypothetical protein VMH77_01455 [Steroidobacteraceae bacterium]|nr:hypothetical protein [Steroidobacteraceae bacterium]
MRETSFRFCMLIGALALGGVAIFYLVKYVVLKIALDNSGVQPFIQHSVQAMWLSFSCQGLLIGLLYLLVAYRPHSMSREVIVLLGLMQLMEAVLLFALAVGQTLAMLLVVAAAFVLLGALLWPKKLPATPAPPADAARQGASGGP